MKKTFRVKKSEDFSTIFSKKQSVGNRQFVVYYLQKENQEYLKTGLSVSKKLGNAVVRNRIKRKIRRAIYDLKNQLHQNYDIIIIARAPVVEMSLNEVKSSLLHVFNLAHLIKEETSEDCK